MTSKIFGVLFLLGGSACAFMAYMVGGPAWHEGFRINKMMSQGGIYFALGGAVCLVIGFLLLRKKRSTPS